MPKQNKQDKTEKKKREGKLSLYPLTMEEALRKLLKVKPPQKGKISQR